MLYSLYLIGLKTSGKVVLISTLPSAVESIDRAVASFRTSKSSETALSYRFIAAKLAVNPPDSSFGTSLNSSILLSPSFIASSKNFTASKSFFS